MSENIIFLKILNRILFCFPQPLPQFSNLFLFYRKKISPSWIQQYIQQVNENGINEKKNCWNVEEEEDENQIIESKNWSIFIDWILLFRIFVTMVCFIIIIIILWEDIQNAVEGHHRVYDDDQVWWLHIEIVWCFMFFFILFYFLKLNKSKHELFVILFSYFISLYQSHTLSIKICVCVCVCIVSVR